MSSPESLSLPDSAPAAVPDSGIVGSIARASERARYRAHGPIWLALRPHDELLDRARALEASSPGARESQPLYGLPFAVKDNIDVAGLPTSAGCPAFAYTPRESARVVELLERAGAVCIGKTHLDQFATGLVGTRSPLGPVPNPFDDRYVCGGSSSGSAAAVALGQVAFALGTDTAGSGRIPASFNNLVGIKPSFGLVSTRGVVPACRSLDCVAIFARDLSTAWSVLAVIGRPDPQDSFARRIVQRRRAGDAIVLGLPEPCRFQGDAVAERHHRAAVDRWRRLGANLVEVPFAPFAEVAALLYNGPWVAERDAAVGDFIAAHRDACDPTVRSIVESARRYSATDAFRALYRLRELSAEIAPTLAAVDALLVPTAPTHPRLDEVARDPMGTNAKLGTYVNFVNLLDLAAIAVPAGFRSDGLPAGFTLIGPAGSDYALADLARRYLERHPNTLGTSGELASTQRDLQPLDTDAATIRLAVAGAHMRGLPLHHELVAEQAQFVASARTAPRYRLHALCGAIAKPGLARVASGGARIGVELWDLAPDAFGRFVSGIPAPMAIGSIELEDGSWVKGFVCEPIALAGSTDITQHGDWRSYLATLRSGSHNLKGDAP